MSQNYQAFLDEHCEKLGTNHTVNSFSIRSFLERANVERANDYPSVKKMLNNAGHIDAKLIYFSEICQKNPAKSAVFYWLFLGEVSPRNFPWNRPIFLRICPWKSFEIWLFSAKIPRNRPIFLRILTFLPRKSRKISPFLCEFWLFSRENPGNPLIFPRILTFFLRKSREINRFFRKFPPENPAKFCFFSAKYQKPCSVYKTL